MARADDGAEPRLTSGGEAAKDNQTAKPRSVMTTSTAARNRVDKAGRAACRHPRQISSTPPTRSFAFPAQSRKSFDPRCLCLSCRSPERHAQKHYLCVDRVPLKDRVFSSPPKSHGGNATLLRA